MDRLITFLMLSIFLICICVSSGNSNFSENSSFIQTSLHDVESRRKKTGHYFLYPYHGWYALSWIYWIKVKLIVVAFFVGTAFIWAIQFIGKFYHHCPYVSHTYHGHYRSGDDPTIARFLRNLHKH